MDQADRQDLEKSPLLMSAASRFPSPLRSGDRIILERADGLFDVIAVTPGAADEVTTHFGLTRYDATVNAASNKGFGGCVWYRDDATPDEVVLYRFQAERRRQSNKLTTLRQFDGLAPRRYAAPHD
jgi:hypothetical protein